MISVVACGSSVAPSPRSHAPPPPVRSDAAAAPVADAPPRPLERSAPLGPVIDSLSDRRDPPQDHEVTLRTATERITLVDGNVEVALLDDPAGRMHSPDGTWAVEPNHKTHTIVAGPIVDGKLVKPVVIHRGTALIRFVGATAGQRTVVLDRSNWGWFVVRSQDGGKNWSETRLAIASSWIATSRRSIDLVSRDGNWIRIDRDGDVTTISITDLVPGWFTCASANLWVPDRDRLHWFDTKTHGTVAATARGPMSCAGEAVLVPVDGGLARCTHAGCGTAEPAGDFADLTSDGIATATQRDTTVHIARTGRAAVDVQLDPGENLVALAVWQGVPTLILLGADKRLRLASVL